MKKSIGNTGVETITQCPVCGSTNITFNMGTEEVKEGCVSGCLFSYIWIIILLLIPIVGWIILIIKLRDKKIDSVTYAVCQNCGNSWVAQNKNAERRKKQNRGCVIAVVVFLLVYILAFILYYLLNS